MGRDQLSLALVALAFTAGAGLSAFAPRWALVAIGIAMALVNLAADRYLEGRYG